jgi:hypothetical protein
VGYFLFRHILGGSVGAFCHKMAQYFGSMFGIPWVSLLTIPVHLMNLWRAVKDVEVCVSGEFTKDVLRKLDKQVRGEMSPYLMPASLLTLESYVTPSDYFVDPEDFAEDVKIDVRIEEVYEPSDYVTPVEIFGTTGEEVSLAYPETKDEAGTINLAAGAGMRLGKKMPSDPRAEKSFYKWATNIIDTFPVFELDPVSREETYSFLCGQYGRKAADDKMAMYDVDIRDTDEEYVVFPKKEVYTGCGDYEAFDEDYIIEGFDGVEGRIKTPRTRVIWKCPDVYVAKFGKSFNQLSKKLTAYFSQDSRCFYTNCASPSDVGSYGALMDTVCAEILESDVSNWDGSVTKTMLRVEKYFLLNKVTGLPEDFSHLLSNWGKVKGRTKDSKMHITMEHGRRSGDLWTSSFNSLLNFLIVSYVYEVDPKDFMMMVLGDDNVVGFYRPLEHSIQYYVERYAKIGMKCAIIPRDNILQATFCSGRFWVVDECVRWGNNPFRLLSKFGINYHNHHRKNFKRLLYGMSKGLLCTAGHVPILGSFLRAIADSAEEHRIKALKDNRHLNPYRIHGGLPSYPAGDTYLQFSEIYGIPVPIITEIEEWIECNVTIDSFPGLWHGEIFHEGFKKDLGVSSPAKLHSEFRFKTPIDVRSYDFIVNHAPALEEVEKLEGARSLSEALKNAWDYGSREDDLIGGHGHAYLHVLFTSLSWINLDLGIGAHSAYNHLAFVLNSSPCALEYLESSSSIPSNMAMPIGFMLIILIYMGVMFDWLPAAGRKKKKKKKARRRKKAADSVLKTLGRTLLTEGGGALGSLVPIPGASAFGRKAGAFLSRITGMGDYEVRENTLFHGQVPEFGKGHHSVSIRNREFLGDVTGSTAWTTTNFTINPGVVSTFPWLSKMSHLYQQYTIKGLIFEFRSTSATALNSTNTALGTVVMATRYNVYDEPFASKLEAENHDFSTSNRPSESMIHPIECDPRETPYTTHFVRNGGLSASEDQRLYDWGVFTIATVGMQASSTIGELWVSYDIEFIKPRLNPGAYPNPLHGRISNAATDASNPLGILQRGVGGNMNLTVSATGAGFDTINFPTYVRSGRFMIAWYVHTALSGGTSITTFNNCALSTSGWGFRLDTDWFVQEVGSADQPRMAIIDILGPGPSIVFTNSGTTTTSIDVYVIQMPAVDSFPLVVSSVMTLGDDEKDDWEETAAPLTEEEKMEWDAFYAWKHRHSTP